MQKHTAIIKIHGPYKLTCKFIIALVYLYTTIAHMHFTKPQLTFMSGHQLKLVNGHQFGKIQQHTFVQTLAHIHKNTAYSSSHVFTDGHMFLQTATCILHKPQLTFMSGHSCKHLINVNGHQFKCINTLAHICKNTAYSSSRVFTDGHMYRYTNHSSRLQTLNECN